MLFDADGSVRLTDFGVAKRLGDDVTHTGGLLGTAAYLSPEQAYEERASFISGINVTEAFKPLHHSPRWERLVAKMGLERRR